MPSAPLTPKKKKIRILLIILSRLMTDTQVCDYAASLSAYFNAIKAKTDENQLSVSQLAQLGAMDAWYATADSSDSPDTFDAWSVTSLPSGFADAAANF